MTSKAIYFPNEIKYNGHYYCLVKTTFVGNLGHAKKCAKELKKEYADHNNYIVRRFSMNVNVYECHNICMAYNSN
jgi:hypothetical protein